MRREQLDALAESDALVVEGVQYLEEVSDVLFVEREPEALHEPLELGLAEDSIWVVVYLPEQPSESSQVGLVLAHLEVLEGVQEICEVDLDSSGLIELLLK